MRHKKIIFFSILLFLAFFALAKNARASDITAASCSKADVKTAITNCFKDASCSTVNIPAGNCTWLSSECDSLGSSYACINYPEGGSGSGDDQTVTKGLNIIGAGKDQTVISLEATGSAYTFFRFKQNLMIPHDKDWRLSGFKLITGTDKVHSAILVDDARWLQVDNTEMYGMWHGLMPGKRVDGGLIFNNKFTQLPGSTSDYGISPGQNQSWSSATYSCADPGYIIDGITKCDDWNNPTCQSWWAKWYAKPGCQGGIPFVENWDPSNTAQALFVEGNTFYWKGSVIEANWLSTRAMVWRYNTIYNADGNNGGWKPGAWYVLFYNNWVENTYPGSGGSALYARSDSMIYNNTFKNYSDGGEIAQFYVNEGMYIATPIMARTDELFVWGNHYLHDSGNTGCDYDNSTCWECPGSMGECLISEGAGYWFSSPASVPGQRLAGFSWPTCPHPLAGLTGTCDTSITGQAGYNVIGSDTTPPAAPSGVTVN